ncbi:MAG: helix-turn-helix domain-containing protein [Pirellulales bacterium]|nr:helix-turn-helix domain-containing protein [Pirellulales bacterium]
MSSTELVAPASPSGPLLLTAEEFAEMMQISTRTLWRLRSAGLVPAPVRIGGTVRWNRETVIDWIAAGCPSSIAVNNDRRRR